MIKISSDGKELDLISSKNRKDKILIEVIGGNAENVTGSASLVTYNKKQLLFEFGMIQRGKNIYENYMFNKELLSSVKTSRLDYIIIGHCHCDHIGLIPALYQKNCDATVIVPAGSYAILKEMWLDSAYINERDADILTTQRERTFTPLFNEQDVYEALNHVRELNFHEIISLDDELSIRYSYAGHILLSAQTELFITQKNHTKKILFTSDLGNLNLIGSKIFVEPFEPVTSANIVIGEATYSSQQKPITKKDLLLDKSKIQTVIQQYCAEQKGIVLIPCFSLDRLPYMLWLLFSMDSSIRVPIIVDSPLGLRLLQAYRSILPESMKDQFESLLSWEKIKFIKSPEDSMATIADGKPKVVLASSGMLTAGRSVKWTQSVISNHNNCILFIGYAATATLAYRIKHSKENPTITINGKICKNHANIVDLHSFSSHMQHDDLLKYYAGINTEKIYLVHSSQDSKLLFKQELEQKIAENCRSARVIAVNRSTKITL